MKSIQVSFSSKKSEYPIFIGKGIFIRHSGKSRSAGRIQNLSGQEVDAARDSGQEARLTRQARMTGLRSYSKIVVVTDTNVKKLLKKILNYLPYNVSVITIPAGERAKSIEYVSEIWKEMVSLGLDRKSLLINFGGGVVMDVGGFAASTYMRGIDFLNIPTTLLSQVDASVGGKTGIDFLGIKNLVGTFDQPKGVLIDVETLTTLPKREFLSGFAEIIKHGLIMDKKYFEKVTSKHPLKFTQDEMIDIIAQSCQIKAGIVESDERETGVRKLLNFGHTIGHAIEAISLQTKTPLLHGEAISIGMWTEAKISSLVNLLSISDLKRIRQALINADLPITTSDIEIDKVLNMIKRDKKNEKGKINFTLLQGIGKAVYNQNVPDEVIVQALKYVTK